MVLIAKPPYPAESSFREFMLNRADRVVAVGRSSVVGIKIQSKSFTKNKRRVGPRVCPTPGHPKHPRQAGRKKKSCTATRIGSGKGVDGRDIIGRCCVR